MNDVLAAALAAAHVAGLASIPHVLAYGRTVQGTIAWAVALLTFPYVSVPFYWVFGRYRYEGYIQARRAGDLDIHHVADELRQRLSDFDVPGDDEARLALFGELARMPFTRGNRVALLVDGDATFESLLAGIDAARDYVLLQYYILRDDGIGGELKRRLVARARAGVRVHLLYDAIGCYHLPPQYLAELREAGVHVRAFGTLRRRINRLQINFRNHRKIVVVDGRRAWTGGHNVGDEYLGSDPALGPWRDTTVVVEGPAAQCIQLSFLEDWYWADRTLPELDWHPRSAAGGDQRALALPTGPADPVESCTLFFLHVIHSAKRRLWIASAYFVPDEPVVSALQLAALRGVDVRILLPEKADHLLVWLSSFSYYEEMQRVGVEIHRFRPGFMHQKVLLVDDELAAVGTANLDNRSFRLNFEIALVVHDARFASDVAEMLERDFESSEAVVADDLTRRSWLFRAGVRFARLLAPIQ